MDRMMYIIKKSIFVPLFMFYQHTQFVLDSAREKRDMEQKHSAIKKMVIR